MDSANRGYSDATEELIQRMCRNVEREDFTLDKDNAEEALLKTYDLFSLSRPKKVVWVKDIFDDIFDKTFDNVASSARSARSAWSARSVWSASLARSARSAWSTSSASSASLARSASSARLAWSAIDYDFDYYVYNFEYRESNSDCNENDIKYLRYCELLMQAKEYGAGYMVEWEDTLYIAPTPIVRVDSLNRFHSVDGPAIRWEDASEFYYLSGVNFNKKLWEKIVKQTIKSKEVLGIKNTEQRMIAMKFIGMEKFLKDVNATLISKTDRGNELYLIKDVFSVDAYFIGMTCPSTGRYYLEGVDPAFAQKHPNADACQAFNLGIPLVEYISMEVEA